MLFIHPCTHIHINDYIPNSYLLGKRIGSKDIYVRHRLLLFTRVLSNKKLLLAFEIFLINFYLQKNKVQ